MGFERRTISPRRDLNSRPSAYHADALPLSYRGECNTVVFMHLYNFYMHLGISEETSKSQACELCRSVVGVYDAAYRT